MAVLVRVRLCYLLKMVWEAVEEFALVLVSASVSASVLAQPGLE